MAFVFGMKGRITVWTVKKGAISLFYNFPVLFTVCWSQLLLSLIHCKKNSVCILKETDDCRIIPDWEENSAHNVSHEKRFIFFLVFLTKMAVICSFFSRIWFIYCEQNFGWNSDDDVSQILGLQINRKIRHLINSIIKRKCYCLQKRELRFKSVKLNNFTLNSI